MKLARYSSGSCDLLGLVQHEGLIDTSRHLAGAPLTMIELIENWRDLRPRLEALASRFPDCAMGDATLLAPIRRPGKIMAIGLNYDDHIAESGLERPAAQTWFAKMPTSINDPFGDIQLPLVSDQLDYEAELVVVIGRRCRHVSRKEVNEVIFGYMAGNDVSVRDWQRKSSQFIIGKSFDSHAPVGPWIVTADEVDPHRLPIRCLVNGEVRQESSTANLVFDVFDMIEELSKAMTLEPGDLIFTGTPGGVAAAMPQPKWLKAGDVVRVEIDGIGAIENHVVEEQAA